MPRGIKRSYTSKVDTLFERNTSYIRKKESTKEAVIDIKIEDDSLDYSPDSYNPNFYRPKHLADQDNMVIFSDESCQSFDLD